MPNIIRRTNTIMARLLLLLFAMTATLTTSASDKKEIIIACDWDFAPYEFINSSGQSDGFSVNVLDAILKELGIPHKFMMKARKQSVAAFKNHEADLIIDYRNRYDSTIYYRTAAPIGYYQVMAAHHKNRPNVTNINDLKGKGITVFNGNNDSIAKRTLGNAAKKLTIEYQTPREALSAIENNEYRYYIWGEEMLKWKIKEYNLSNVVLNKMLDLPADEIRIAGYDEELINEIGSQYARLQQSGEIIRLRQKWFNPEEIEERTSSTVLYLILATILASIFFFVLYRLAKKRVKLTMHRNQDTESMMHQALSMGEYFVIAHNRKRNRTINLHGHALPDEGITEEELLQLIHPDDREMILEHWNSKDEDWDTPRAFTIRYNIGTTEEPQWATLAGYSYLEHDERQRLENIIITSRNITKQLEAEKADHQWATRYRRMFDSSLIAMSFYDNNGYVIDLNDKMRELSSINKENEAFFFQTSLFDLDMVKGDFTPTNKDEFHVCQHMRYPEHGIDKYIEFRVSPALGENHEAIAYVVTARDITEERNMYMDLARQNKALQEAEETNSRYEQEMRVLMENCNMYAWRLDFATNIISFSLSLGKVEFTRTLKEHLDSMFDEDRVEALNRAKHLRSIDQTFSTIHHFRYTPISDKPSWQATSGMPLADEKGNITCLFGIVRDITPLMEAQERLKEETARAENSAMLKSTFLANMTHEIRTPLNSIVGFSDLLHMVSTTEERKEFIHIIRNNCDMLMRLINDIFEASTMDIKPLEIKPEECDFAQFFNITSQSLSERVQNPDVQFIVDNPYQQFITLLDQGRMQQVITNFVTNAVKYTHQGHIKVGYRYQKEDDGEHQSPDGEREGIYMYCEDTGDGIPKDKQKSVFDRFVKLNDFVQGTGLGLSICKSIAERSNGHIGVDSEGPGTGCTFWIWVPCPIIKQS